MGFQYTRCCRCGTHGDSDSDSDGNAHSDTDSYFNSVIVRGGGWIDAEGGSFRLPTNGRRYMDFWVEYN